MNLTLCTQKFRISQNNDVQQSDNVFRLCKYTCKCNVVKVQLSTCDLLSACIHADNNTVRRKKH